MNKKKTQDNTDTITDDEQQLAAALAEAVAIYDTAWDWDLSVLERKQAREMALYVAVSRWPQWFLPMPVEPLTIGAGANGSEFVSNPPKARSAQDIECLTILAGLPSRCADVVMAQWLAAGLSPEELRHVARKRCDEVLEAQRAARR